MRPQDSFDVSVNPNQKTVWVHQSRANIFTVPFSCGVMEPYFREREAVNPNLKSGQKRDPHETGPSKGKETRGAYCWMRVRQ